ncbi:MAG: hypothetical protein AVDCRST_MAG38-405, partial [uncultured Solirubrobacteraceae bacterium]
EPVSVAAVPPRARRIRPGGGHRVLRGDGPLVGRLGRPPRARAARTGPLERRRPRNPGSRHLAGDPGRRLRPAGLLDRRGDRPLARRVGRRRAAVARTARRGGSDASRARASAADRDGAGHGRTAHRHDLQAGRL